MGRSGSGAGSRFFEKLPLKMETLIFLPGRLRLTGVDGGADPGDKSPK